MNGKPTQRMETAQKRAMGTIQAYRDRWEPDGTGHMSDERLQVQAKRAAIVADRLRRPAVVILNDPVGTGKTIVALAAARLLLDQWPVVTERVERVVIVAPNAELAAEWVRRSHDAGLSPRSAHGPSHGENTGTRIDVVTARELARPNSLRLPERSRVLVIVDEAHRGLHDRGSDTYQALVRKTRGARVLLVTATPFQMRPSGLEAMIEIGGDEHAGDRIRTYGAAVAAWLRARYECDFAADGLDVESLKLARDTAAQLVATTRMAAKDDLDTVFMPPYPRDEMRLPADFVLPKHADDVPVDDDWLLAYHAARLLPEVLGDLMDGSRARSARNSDSYMRMLNSSLGAWRRTTVVQSARALAREAKDQPTGRALGAFLTRLDVALGTQPLDHPKVRQTATLALAKATAAKPRHVLIFCEFLGTQADVEKAVQQLIAAGELGGPNPSVRAYAPTTRHYAHRIHAESFGSPPGPENPPVILVVSDKLSESVDLDGGRPVVIHHDLAWSPVRWTQRMGRVVRARTGFQPLRRADVIVPVLPTRIDQRLWDTVVNRHKLMRAAIGDDQDALVDLARAMADTQGDAADG